MGNDYSCRGIFSLTSRPCVDIPLLWWVSPVGPYYLWLETMCYGYAFG